MTDPVPPRAEELTVEEFGYWVATGYAPAPPANDRAPLDISADSPDQDGDSDADAA